jgi:gliding motility-associated-like protein
LCQGESIVLASSTPLGDPLWSDGSTGASLLVSEEGWYWLESGTVCGQRDSLFLSILPRPELSLLPLEPFLCQDSSLTLRLEGEWPVGTQFTWSGGQSGTSLQIDAPGLYAVQADADGCVAEAEALVQEGPCGCRIQMPNAFTPNGDGLNDRFRPVLACALEDYRFSVFNRWGQVVFSSTDPAGGWDGTLAGKAQEKGAYLWTLEAIVLDRGRSGVQSLSGSVTLLR